MDNIVTWVEIPVTDFERAKAFYETVFQGPLEVSEVPIQMPGHDSAQPIMGKMGILPGSDPAKPGAGAAIFQGHGYVPSSKAGPLVYLNAGHDLAGHLTRVTQAGGHVFLEWADLGEIGAMAIIIDSEDNQIALHEQPAQQ